MRVTGDPAAVAVSPSALPVGSRRVGLAAEQNSLTRANHSVRARSYRSNRMGKENE